MIAALSLFHRSDYDFNRFLRPHSEKFHHPMRLFFKKFFGQISPTNFLRKRKMFKELLFSRKFRISIAIVIATLFFGEYLIYYFVLGVFCSWPSDISSKSDTTAVRALILADPHLLGIRHGHWFDKFRREWQMERAFRAAMTIFDPDVVFVLGDLFDEGQYAQRDEMETYAGRFWRIFETNGRPLYAAVGNHDVGFHYAITERKLRWFYDAFKLDSIHPIVVKDVIFVLINSMAFEGDHCRLCAEAERRLGELNQTLECVQKRSNSSGDCPGYHHLRIPAYSRPVLLQHFPLYRFSEATCNEPDEAPASEKIKPFNQRWDCLSEEATNLLLNKLQPRVAFDGHSHFGCLTRHKSVDGNVSEYTVGSFSCRNTKNPSFLLASFTPTHSAVSKCLSVREDTVYAVYAVVLLLVPALVLAFACSRRCRSVGIRKQI